MLEQGYTTLTKVRGIPLRVHFSIALGLLFLSGFHFRPGLWLGYLTVIIVHELGHAAIARAYRLKVFRIDLHGLGGECWTEPPDTAWQDSVLAWGGVLAQLVLFAVALSLGASISKLGPVAGQLVDVLLGTNLLIAAFNLLPLNGFDGRKAWRLPRLLYARLRKSSSLRRKRGAQVKVRQLGDRPRARAGDVPELKLVRDENGDFRFEAKAEEEQD